MKHLVSLLLCASVFNLSAVPLRWTVETSRAQPAAFEAYQGETLELEARLQTYGKPLEAPSSYALYWQTNGMGSTYWSTNVSNVSNLSNPSNLLRATWRPEYDVGARAYTCFIGQPGTIYHAAFQLRLRPSPGAVPNELPLPVKTIDFSKVVVTNAPWITEETDPTVPAWAKEPTPPKSTDGAARPLPKYLHALDFSDSYTNDAAWYYEQAASNYVSGSCSARRLGGLLERNYDWTFDDTAEFVVRMGAGPNRFASIGVANVGTNLTEQIVTSGRWSRYYKALPGHTLDGINERGVVAEINVVDGDPQTSGWHAGGDIHPLGAVRWALDHATSAGMAASNLAARIAFPHGWTQNFHYMVADEREPWIVRNGTASVCDENCPAITNFDDSREPLQGAGVERWFLLRYGHQVSITNVWWTNAYDPAWYDLRASDLAGLDTGMVYRAWAAAPRESHRGESFGGTSWWQTVHTSIYDITNRTMRIAVQETDDWYTFALSTAGADDEKVRTIVEPMISNKADRAATLSGYGITNGVSNTELAQKISTHDNNDDAHSEKFSRYAKLTEDDDGDLSAFSIGSRLTYTGRPRHVGRGSLVVGWKCEAAGIRSHAEGYYSQSHGDYSHAYGNFAYTLADHDFAFAWQGETNTIYSYTSHGPGTYNLNPVGGLSGFWVGETNMARHIKNLAPHYTPSATDPIFSNAVLAVGLNIDTNSVAVLNEIAATFGDFPIEGTATTVGGLLAALAAAIAWLKKNKAARGELRYAFASSSATVQAQDRTVTKVTLGTTSVTVTFPDATAGKTRDFLLRIDAANLATGGALVITKPTGATIYGDAFPSPAAGKQYLVAITETAANEFYVRTIEITTPTEG